MALSEDELNELGERLAYYRNRVFGETQTEFGDRLGISRSYYANIESGTGTISERKVMEFAEKLGMGFADLIASKDMRESPAPYGALPAPAESAGGSISAEAMELILDLIERHGGMDAVKKQAELIGMEHDDYLLNLVNAKLKTKRI